MRFSKNWIQLKKIWSSFIINESSFIWFTRSFYILEKIDDFKRFKETDEGVSILTQNSEPVKWWSEYPKELFIEVKVTVIIRFYEFKQNPQ